MKLYYNINDYSLLGWLMEQFYIDKIFVLRIKI